MILLWAYWLLNIVQIRSVFTFSRDVLESSASNLVWCLFETLSVATRFNPEPMVFLIEVNFRKGSKIWTMFSKIRKIRNFWHHCWKLVELHPTFFFPNSNLNSLLFQRSDQWKFYCSKTFVVWTKIAINLSKNMLFCCFMDFGSEASTSNKLQLYLRNCLLDIRIRYCWVSKSILCIEEAQKLNRKTG